MGYIDEMRQQIRGEYSPIKKKVKPKVKTIIKYVPVGYGYPQPMMYYPQQPKRTTSVRRTSKQISGWAKLREEQGQDAYASYKQRKQEKQLKRIVGGITTAGRVAGSIGSKVSGKMPRLGSIYSGIFAKKVSLPKATEKEVD
jgi:hypothetical protein